MIVKRSKKTSIALAIVLGLTVIAPTAANASPVIQQASVQIKSAPLKSMNITDNWRPFNNVWSFNIQTDQIFNLTATGFSGDSGDFYIQEKKSGKWVNVSKVKKTYNSSNRTYKISYSVPSRNGGTSSEYRLNHPQTSKMKVWSSSSNKVNYKSAKTTIYSGVSITSKIATKNGKIATANLQVLNGSGRTAYLQRYNSKTKKWGNVSSAKLSGGGWAKANIKVPAYSKAGTYSYRVHVPASPKYVSATSKSMKVSHIDPSKYKGYQKTSYDAVKKYCPYTLSTIVSPKGKPWKGLAEFGGYSYKIVSGMNAAANKFVSLHECAHGIQGKVYPNYREFVRAADKVYGKGKGVEHMADCMAYVMGASRQYYGYTRDCSGARHKAAVRVVSGKKL